MTGRAINPQATAALAKVNQAADFLFKNASFQAAFMEPKMREQLLTAASIVSGFMHTAHHLVLDTNWSKVQSHAKVANDLQLLNPYAISRENGEVTSKAYKEVLQIQQARIAEGIKQEGAVAPEAPIHQ